MDRKCLSWHLHCLVWGISLAEMEMLVEHLAASGLYRPIAPGLLAVDFSEILQGRLPRTVGYMLKSPTVGYRVTRYDRRADGLPHVDANGFDTPYFLQGKSKLRPGEHLQLFHAIKRIYLPNLCIAGGEGTPLLARAKRIALEG